MSIVRVYTENPGLQRCLKKHVEKPFGVTFEFLSGAPPFDASFVFSTTNTTSELVVMANQLGAELIVLPEAAYYVYSKVCHQGGTVVAVGSDHRNQLCQPITGVLF